MNVQQRLHLLNRLGGYILDNSGEWQQAKEEAYRHNSWFTPEFTDLATNNIAKEFLQEKALATWCERYNIPAGQQSPKNVGIVMAGNIPLVGFHDFLCTFIAGHRQTIKPSSKDDVLIKHLSEKLINFNEECRYYMAFAELLKGCDAYLATGSNNSARYFEYYFSRYPNIIRRNRTSIAVLTGNESNEELEKLADDIHLYFGLGCRNVTKIYVPRGYDFIPLLEIFKKYHYLSDHNKYKNNYDYILALLMLNKQFYMTNGSILLLENKSNFTPVSQLNYEFYENSQELRSSLTNHPDIQCIVGKGYTPFGNAQKPALDDYADGIDTLQFLLGL